MATLRRKRIDRYKKKILPEANLSLGTSGAQVTFGFTTTVVQSDKSYVDSLINTLDSKGSLYAAMINEASVPLIEPIKEVRGAALNTKNLVEGLDSAELCDDMIDACRIFMNTYNTANSAASQSLAVEAMRKGVLTSAAALVELCELPTPRNLPLTQYARSGVEVIEDMLMAQSEVEEELREH